jgi:hypothetical protein
MQAQPATKLEPTGLWLTVQARTGTAEQHTKLGEYLADLVGQERDSAELNETP